MQGPAVGSLRGDSVLPCVVRAHVFGPNVQEKMSFTLMF